MTETWVLLGATSSVARAFAGLVAAEGAKVLLAGRDAAELDRLAADLRIRHGGSVGVIGFDALIPGDPARLAATLDLEPGRLSVFVALGHMPPQAVCEKDPTRGAEVIGVNFTAVATTLLHLADRLERQGSGRVVVLGSVAGDRGRRSNYVYGSAKAGLHAFLQGFRARMLRSRVTVTTIKPGFTDTAMTWGVPGMFLVASPQAVARRSLALARKGSDEAYVPFFWALIMAIIKAIPERLFKRLNL